MQADENTIRLDYNTEMEKLRMPEYGRNVRRMVSQVKQIEDRAKRTEQARAVVRVMELLNPQVHSEENIESIIDLIAGEPDGEQKTAMIRSLAIYMRQQYLIWNKDSVADETIFKDIEKLSDGRITVPEGISLSRIASDATFARPGMNLEFGKRPDGYQNFQKKKFYRKNFQKR